MPFSVRDPERRLFGHKLLTTVSALLISTLFVSCATSSLNKRVLTFSKAASLAATNSQSAFETVQQHYEQTQVDSLVLNYERDGFNPDRVKALLNPEDLQVRKSIFSSLQRYAETLSEITGGSQDKQFDDATKKLGQSLQSLNGNDAFKKFVGQAPGRDIHLATTAINTLGRWFVERKRTRELPRIINEMHPAIENLAQLLIDDLGSAPRADGTGGRGLRGQLWIQYTKSMTDQDAFIRANSAKLDASARRIEITKLPRLVEDRRRADLALAATQKTLTQLIEAHAKLRDAKDDDDGGFLAAIQQLVAEGQRIKDFYESLETKR